MRKIDYTSISDIILDAIVKDNVKKEVDKIVHSISEKVLCTDLLVKELLKPWDSVNLFENIQGLHKTLHSQPASTMQYEYVITPTWNYHENYLNTDISASDFTTAHHNYSMPNIQEQDKTLPSCFLILDESLAKVKQTMEEVEDTLYKRSSKDYCAYYESIKLAHKLQVRNTELALERWKCKKCRDLTEADVKEKTEGVKASLSEIDSEIPFDYFLRGGPDDTSAMGRYLICTVPEWPPEKTQKTIELLVSLQWLAREKEMLKISSKQKRILSKPNLETDFGAALKDVFHNQLGMKNDATKVTIKEKERHRDDVIVTMMNYLKDIGILKEAELSKFTPLVAPILGIPVDNDNLRRTCSNSLTDLKKYGLPQKVLGLHEIKSKYSFNKIEADKAIAKWGDLYADIAELAEQSEQLEKLKKNCN